MSSTWTALSPFRQRQLAALQRVNAVNVPIQFGGGLRSVEQVEQVFEMGVTRVVLGTAASIIELVKDLLARWGTERVALGIDARRLSLLGADHHCYCVL